MSVAGADGAAAIGGVDGVATTLRSEPALAAAVVLGTLVVIVVLWWVVRWLRRPAGERLRRLLEAQDAVTVLMHPNPDPDAMACAIAVDHLAESVDTDSTIQFPGQIRHQENRAFQTVLDLDFERIENAAEIPTDAVVLVDHNEPRGFVGAENVEPTAVVDHHPGDGTGADFTDVRTDNGACASIFAEYFEDIGWEPLPPEKMETAETDTDVVTPRLSTGLLYGIQSDTKNLTKGCSADEFSAAAYLYEGIDEDSLDRIANPEVDAEVLDVQARAITGRTVRNAFAVSDVGEVSNVDAIPQAADELLRLEGVTAVVVFGEHDGTMHLSGRSRDDRVHMGKALRAVVEDIPMADAGGHARMGGGQVSVQHMAGLGPGNGVSTEEFTDRLFDAMAGNV